MRNFPRHSGVGHCAVCTSRTEISERKYSYLPLAERGKFLKRLFDPESGFRHLQLASTDLDMVDSRIRLLLCELKDVAEIETLLP